MGWTYLAVPRKIGKQRTKFVELGRLEWVDWADTPRQSNLAIFVNGNSTKIANWFRLAQIFSSPMDVEWWVFPLPCFSAGTWLMICSGMGVRRTLKQMPQTLVMLDHGCLLGWFLLSSHVARPQLTGRSFLNLSQPLAVRHGNGKIQPILRWLLAEAGYIIASILTFTSVLFLSLPVGIIGSLIWVLEDVPSALVISVFFWNV